jgi:hypothetical protein
MQPVHDVIPRHIVREMLDYLFHCLFRSNHQFT